jgi:hypothetical protein
LLLESFATVAVNCVVAPACTVAEALESVTLIGGGGGGVEEPPPHPKKLAATATTTSALLTENPVQCFPENLALVLMAVLISSHFTP